MVKKEWRRLKREDLLQMLLTQCEETEKFENETEKLRQEAAEMQGRMDAILESYERLKKKLDVKDERLNQKDAKIAELRRELEELKAEKEAREDRVSAMEEAFYHFRDMFEEVQRTVTTYMANERKRNAKQIPFETGRIISIYKKQNGFRNGQTEAGLEQNAAVEEQPGEEYGIVASGDIYG